MTELLQESDLLLTMLIILIILDFALVIVSYATLRSNINRVRNVQRAVFPSNTLFSSLRHLTKQDDVTLEEIVDEIEMWDCIHTEIETRAERDG